MEDRLSYRAGVASGKQGLERSTEAQRAEQFPDCILALLPVRKKEGTSPGSDVPGSSDDFASLSRRKSFDGVRSSVSGKNEDHIAAWKRSRTASHPCVCGLWSLSNTFTISLEIVQCMPWRMKSCLSGAQCKSSVSQL